MSSDQPDHTPPQTIPTVTNAQIITPRLVTVGQFSTVVIIWSFTPLAAVWTVQALHWAWGLFIRFSLALPIVFGCLAFMGIAMPIHRQALSSYAAGAIGLFGSMTLCYIGAQSIPSAMISMIFGLAPIFSGLLTWLFLANQRLGLKHILGLCLAVVGMALSMGFGQAKLHFQLWGILTVFMAVLLYVVSSLLVRKVGAEIHPLSQTAGATLFSWLGFLILLPFYTADMPTLMPSLQTSIAVLYSAIFSSVLAMVCYYALIQRLNATTAMLTTMTTPVLATIWGMFLNDEQLGPHFMLGLALLCTGLYIYSQQSSTVPNHSIKEDVIA